jgi:Domain of unknown function DUF29
MAVGDSDLYDTDILLWSERQADLLRRHAAGERVNDASIDWPNIVEEIEDVGRSELNSVESLLVPSAMSIISSTKYSAWSSRARVCPSETIAIITGRNCWRC